MPDCHSGWAGNARIWDFKSTDRFNGGCDQASSCSKQQHAVAPSLLPHLVIQCVSLGGRVHIEKVQEHRKADEKDEDTNPTGNGRFDFYRPIPASAATEPIEFMIRGIE